MSTVISHAYGVTEPTTVLRIEQTRDAGNIIHPILGNSSPDVTFRTQLKPTGILSLGFYGPTSEEDSRTAQIDHARPIVFTLSSTDRSTIEMSYVVAGPVTRSLEEDSRDAWIVDVTYQEVSV